jgi:hypothetical protein
MLIINRLHFRSWWHRHRWLLLNSRWYNRWYMSTVSTILDYDQRFSEPKYYDKLPSRSSSSILCYYTPRWRHRNRKLLYDLARLHGRQLWDLVKMWRPGNWWLQRYCLWLHFEGRRLPNRCLCLTWRWFWPRILHKVRQHDWIWTVVSQVF